MDALPPDPYAALGVAKDATAAAIKAQYRKLVLRLHPDKVQDESLKVDAADQFHRVQTAYEIVGDEDRRSRYDAQCKLAELRREIIDHGGVSRGYGEPRSTPSRPADLSRGWESYRSGRVSPNYEERRPPYADYFDTPRERSRKDDSYDRSSKRASPRDSQKKSRTSDRRSKENERASREERNKRMDQDVRREREKKFFHASADDVTSDHEEFEQIPRRQSEGDARRSRAPPEEPRRRVDDEAYGAERSQQKYSSQMTEAEQYMGRRGSNANITERRPSPSRKASSRDHIETIRRDGKPPISYRRGSGRPGPTSRDSQRKSSSREKDIEIVDAPEETSRRPPPLNKTMSSPEHIRPPFERQRSNSMQDDHREPPLPSTKPPTMKRAETMPYPTVSTDSRRKESSKSRKDGRNTYPTPEATPEPPSTRKFSYGQAYIVDEPEPISPTSHPSPTYQTVYREPAPRQRFTRSPSPVRESREKSRSTNAKYSTPPPPPPSNKRTTSTTYVFPSEPAETYSRPAVSRENSGRLFGEIQTTARSSRKYSPPADEIRYSPKPRAEDVRASSGYKVRRGGEKPYSRNGQPISVR